MKLCSFDSGGTTRIGAATPHGILDLLEAARRTDDTVEVREMLVAGQFNDAISFLAAGEGARAAAESLVARAAELSDCLHAQDAVCLKAPVPHARKLFCLAGNYQEHIREGGGTAHAKEETYPYFFMKPASTALIGCGEAICLPKIGRAIDWEGELAAVIGRRGREIPAERAEEYVAGYTCFNDVSERRLAVPEGRVVRERDKFFDWLVGKWFDTAAPAGPYLVTRDEVPDPHSLALKLRVNGVTKQDASTSQMIFQIPELIAFISRIVTLEPGDMIATGTPAGVGNARNEFLQAGDVVEVEIERLGILRNPVVAA
jgi:2-keto-4-pentenoate hydratase/2-oxohepta-3-ene-1,7-dioic acid hydratase in catechol pathway